MRHQPPKPAVRNRTAIRILWRWRVELTLAGVLFVVMVVLVNARPVAAVPGLTLLTLLLITGRRPLGRMLYLARTRRRWRQACLDTQVAPEPRLPHVLHVAQTPAGDRLTIRVGRGQSVRTLTAKVDELRAALDAFAVRITPDRQRGSRAEVFVAHHDPFENAPPVPWPLLDATETSVWDPMPFAVSEEGDPVTVETMGGHVLIGGVTGSGKSVALNLFVAHTALDPQAHMILFDNAQVELAPWAACADQFIGANMKDAIRALEAVQRVMERRNSELLAAKARKVSRGEPTYTVVIDELAYYLLHPDGKARDEFLRVLLDLLQRGRKAGVRVVAATQRPAASIFDTNLRAQFSHRIAFRVMEPETTAMILGNREAQAHLIPETHHGVGYLGGEASRPRRVRDYFLTEQDVEVIAARAGGQRLDEELAELTRPPEPAPPRPPAREERERADRKRLAEVLPQTQPGLSRTELERLMGSPHKRWWPELKSMIAAGIVVRDGKGSRGDPYRFRLAARSHGHDVGSKRDPGDVTT